MSRDDLTRLAALAAMKRDADLQDLSKITGRMAALQSDIDTLRAQAQARAANGMLDSSRLSGSDVVWQKWMEQTVGRMQAQMAKLAVVRESHLGHARRSFGRAEAMRVLNERQKKPRR